MSQSFARLLQRSVLLLVFLFAFAYANAQNTENTRYLIQTRDGNIYRGVIVEKQAAYIVFQTDQIGTITIQFEDVQQIQRLDGNTPEPQRNTNNGGFAPPRLRTPVIRDEQYEAAFYILKPSSFKNEKGKGYYQNAWLFLNSVQYNFTDNFSVGFGIVPLDIDGVPAWIQPKFTLPIKKDLVHFSIGALNAVTMGYSQTNFGAVYGEIGFGDAGNNVNVGLGKYYENGEFGSSLMFSFSGTLQLGQSTALATECYVTPNNQFFGGTMHQRLGSVVMQAGLIGFSDNGWLGAVPVLGLSVPFKEK